MCHHHLLVVACHCSFSLVSWSCCRCVLSSPCTIITLRRRYTSLSGCHRAVSSLCCHCPHRVFAPHPWLTSARRHLCPFIVVLCLSEVGGDERGMGGTHRAVKNKQQRQMMTLVVVRHLVATSRTVTWHLDFILTNCIVRRGDFTHLG